MTLKRWLSINWIILAFVVALCSLSLLLLFSAGKLSFQPWVLKQLFRFVLGMILLLAIVSVRIYSLYVSAYFVYALTIILLLLVPILGFEGKGSVRWINLYFFALQPSELVKISIILALGRYLHDYSIYHNSRRLFVPILIILLPALVIFKQPDLGTASLIVISGGILLFIAGLRWYIIIGTVVAMVAIGPFAFHILEPYQQDRILNFLNSSGNESTTAYQIIQSQTAIGSAGLLGYGYGQGPQAQLNFLPEKHTDFIFALLAEEFGLVGALSLIGLYLGLFFYTLSKATEVKSMFGFLVIMSFITNFTLFAFINIFMVMGLAPVVGVPLPLVSYGGTSLLTNLMGFGIIFTCLIDKDSVLYNKRGV